MDLSRILAAFSAIASNWIPVITGVLAVVAGLYFIGSAIYRLVQADKLIQQGQPVWGGVGMGLLLGAALMKLPATMENVSQTFLGRGIEPPRNALAYMPSAMQGSNFWGGVIEICLLFLVLFGWVAAFRGFFQWRTAANGGGNNGGGSDAFFSGFWHIAGGAACINMTGVIRAFFGV